MKKTTFIIDDHSMLRAGLKSFLESNSEWSVIGEASSGSDAVQILRELEELPETAIIDISIPGMDGINLVTKIRESFPNISCIMYSMHVTAEYIQSALKAGAGAYVSKSSPSESVLEALESVSLGNPYLDSYALKIHLGQYAWTSGRKNTKEQEFKSAVPLREPLTFQEGRVFALAAKNMTNTEIAKSLSIKPKTVENYMSIIYQKLCLKNRYELLVYAKEHGVLQ